MATKRPRRDDVEIVDADDIEAGIARDRAGDRARRRQQWAAINWWHLIRGLVALWALWVWFYFLPQWYPFPPNWAGVVDVLRLLPRPPFL